MSAPGLKARRANAGRLAVLALVAIATAAAGACSELGTDPKAAVSIRFDTLPSAAVVQGDTLRDSLGNPAPITATAFNQSGDTIHGATFTFLARDTTSALVVDPAGAFVVAKNGTARSTDVTLQASMGSLQFTRTLAIVPTPDSLAGPASPILPTLVLAPDTVGLRRKNLSSAFTARVLHDTTPAPTPVRAWRVDFAVTKVPDTLVVDSVRIVDANGAFIHSATTGSDGAASALLRIYPRSGLPNGLRRDSVIVTASAIYKAGAEIGGSPVRIVVPFALCSGPTSSCSAKATAASP